LSVPACQKLIFRHSSERPIYRKARLGQVQ
jgi:hypothetical protein